jgi:pyrimidine deaminase RibD-like protein
MYVGSHTIFMQKALEEARKALPVPTAFCVGCVLVVRLPDQDPTILATGFSRELPGNTHAEANALAKARDLPIEGLSSLFGNRSLQELLSLTDVYTTLEPCSVRTSGLGPCADALIEAGVKRCVIGVNEPPDFVNCEGAEKLKAAGIEVVWLPGMEDECLMVARRQD